MYLYENELAGSTVPIHRKRIGRAASGGNKVYVDYEPMSFCLLADSDLLDTADLCRLFGVSQRTVYRWIGGHSLRPATKVGRELLFTKREILRWFRENLPKPGRPPQGGRR